MSYGYPAFDLVEPELHRTLTPGAVVAINTPAHGLQIRAFGYRNLEETEAVTPGDHFRVGSNTKTMTGTAILQLVDNNRLALTDSVASRLPGLHDDKLGRISIKNLLEMRSGLYNYSDLLWLNQQQDDYPDRWYAAAQLAELGLAGDSTGQPGGTFFYCNTNTCLAGLLLEHQLGVPLQAIFQRTIFNTTNMIDTVLPQAPDASLPGPHPRGYMFGTNVSTMHTNVLPPEEQQRAYAGELQPGDYTTMNPSWTWAAGGVVATANDLVSYVEAMVGGGFLSPSLQQQRINSVGPTGIPNTAEYGLALAKFGPMYGHDGTLPGFQSFMGHDPITKNTLIVLANLTASPKGELPANEIAKIIIPAL